MRNVLLFISHLLLQNDLDDPERGMIFVCSATHKTKVGHLLFKLVNK